MELLPLAFTSGWASGINAYGTVLVLGLLGRFADVTQVPDALQRTDVLVVMAILTVIELVADKVPFLDSAWDVVSTVVRPIAGGVIGALLGGAHGDLWAVVLASVGGLTALLSHLVKAGLRVVVNTSPEPASNIAVSVAGDVSVTAAVVLAVLYPVPTAMAAGALLLTGVAATLLLRKRIWSSWQRFRAWVVRLRETRRRHAASIDQERKASSTPRRWATAARRVWASNTRGRPRRDD